MSGDDWRGRVIWDEIGEVDTPKTGLEDIEDVWIFPKRNEKPVNA